MTEFLPGFFIGNYQNSVDPVFLHNNNIRKVVNCTKDLPFYPSDSIQKYRIPINDTSSEQDNNFLYLNIKPVLQFIFRGNPVTRENGILLNCHAGVSRSASVCVAILRACCFKSIPEAVQFLLQKRPQVFFYGTQMNFRKALYDYFKV